MGKIKVKNPTDKFLVINIEIFKWLKAKENS